MVQNAPSASRSYRSAYSHGIVTNIVYHDNRKSSSGYSNGVTVVIALHVSKGTMLSQHFITALYHSRQYTEKMIWSTTAFSQIQDFVYSPSIHHIPIMLLPIPPQNRPLRPSPVTSLLQLPKITLPHIHLQKPHSQRTCTHPPRQTTAHSNFVGIVRIRV